MRPKPNERPRRAVPVEILGKEYRVVTDRDDAWIHRVAELVGRAMERVRDETETVDSLDVAVLTALQLAQNLVILREEGSGAEAAPESPPAPTDAAAGPDGERLREIVDLAEEALRADSTG